MRTRDIRTWDFRTCDFRTCDFRTYDFMTYDFKTNDFMSYGVGQDRQSPLLETGHMTVDKILEIGH